MPRSPLVLAALASAAEPGLVPVATRPAAGEGGDYDTAVVTDTQHRHWVVRSPRRTSAGAALESELTLLARLRAHDLPFAVPDPRRTVELPEGGRAMVYPYLSGHPLHPGELGPGPGLAAAFGRALAALHEVPLHPGLAGSLARLRPLLLLSSPDSSAERSRALVHSRAEGGEEGEVVAHGQPDGDGVVRDHVTDGDEVVQLEAGGGPGEGRRPHEVTPAQQPGG